jgi:hypothetical protein
VFVTIPNEVTQVRFALALKLRGLLIFRASCEKI